MTQKRCALFLWFALASSLLAFAQAQPDTATPSDSGIVIRTQAKLVLVDAIVTDDDGNYVKDLAAADFRVAEDGKEQVIKTFSFETSAETESRKQYMVVLFDDFTMSFEEKVRARNTALRFIDANGVNKQFIAIARYGGNLQITQEFTRDSERLKRAAGESGPYGTNVAGLAANVGIQGDFRARNLLLALRSLAKKLEYIPGRKALVLLSTGFPLTSDRTFELSAAIDACNRSNVAIYAVDVRGLSATTAPNSSFLPTAPRLIPVSLKWPSSYIFNAMFQRTTPSPGPKPLPGGRPGGGQPSGPRPEFRKPIRTVPSWQLPQPPKPRAENTPWFSGSGNFNNQQVLRALAEGTGGFLIANTNDLLGGMIRIGGEQNHYYILGYSPAPSEIGSCHSLKVQVTRPATRVRARRGYCNVAPLDLLAGTPEENELQKLAAKEKSGSIDASMHAAFFYTSANTARVYVAVEIPPESVKLTKDKGKTRAAINVLGTAVKPDGSIAARFSDTVKLELGSDSEIQQFRNKPFHYEKQFDIASGQYGLTVVFNGSEGSFGRLQAPLSIDRYDANDFGLSSIAFSTRALRAVDPDEIFQRQLLQDHFPLVSHGVEFVPSGTNRFLKSDDVFLYVEIYDSLLVGPNKPPSIAIQYAVANTNTKELVLKGYIPVDALIERGNPVVAAALNLPVNSLTPGSYHLELRASDSSGRARIRAADFDVR